MGDQLEVHALADGDAARIAAYVAKYASKGTAGDFTGVGYPGHFSSKSRTYSTTLGALRQARTTYRLGRLRDWNPADA